MIANKLQYGFIPPAIVPEDYFLGSGKLGSVVLNESGDWRPYLPVYEAQNRGFETNACVSHGVCNSLEILLKFQYNKDNIEKNFSDRYLAVTSKTAPTSGNSPKQVSDAVRKFGLVDEEIWPHEGVKTLEEFYKPISEKVLQKGQEFLEEYEFGYEYVMPSQLKDALTRSPVGCAVSAWQTNDKGEYIRFGASNHWVVLVAFDTQDRPVIWDSYESAIKTLEKGYVLEYPQIYVLKRKPLPAVEVKKKNWRSQLLLKIRTWLYQNF